MNTSAYGQMAPTHKHSATEQLAAFLASLDLTSCDTEVLAHARNVFADTVACMIAGLSHPQLERLVSTLRRPGPSEHFTGLQAAPSDLALLLGFAGAALELDEGHYAAGGHPGIHAAAAVLAQNALTPVNLDDCLMGFLVGYEAGARVGSAIRLNPAAHPHGTWGTIGAAVSTAWLRGYDANQMAAAIDVASSLGLATSTSAPIKGASVRSAWVGVAARNGMLACDLVQAGVTGEPDGCSVIYGQVLGTAFDKHVLTDRLGEYFFINDNFMKYHASCRETHGAIAALTKAVGQTRIEPDQIQRIDIETFADAARLCDTNPVNEMAARFSIPAVVAAIILDREVSAENLSSERIGQPAFKALMQRVSVTEAVDATQALPAQRICRCLVALTDGTSLSAEVASAPGDAADPLPNDVLRRKLDMMCGRSRQSKDLVNAAHELQALLQ